MCHQVGSPVDLPLTSALCPGSFDPPTHGHADVIERAASIFDQVIVAVVRNPSKSALFTTEERVLLLEEVLADTPERGGSLVRRAPGAVRPGSGRGRDRQGTASHERFRL